ncbi:MAG: hypothetical protein ABIR57_03685 [Aeromicrobium sp.]
MNELFGILVGLIALVAFLVPLARVLIGDGFGVRPPPHRLGEALNSFTMPHDESRLQK